jgi:alpha-glucosidase
MQMTLPGCPAVYYADEAGQVGWTDPDNRRTYPWGSEDWELIEFHRYAIAIHKRHPSLRKGSYIRLAGGYQWLAYGRFTEREKSVVVVNNNRTKQTLRVPVWPAEVPLNCEMLREIQSIQTGYNVGRVYQKVEDGVMEVTVGPQTAGIYVYSADGPM